MCPTSRFRPTTARRARLSTYFIIHSSHRLPNGEHDVNAPAPWPIIVDEANNIVSGRPDADSIFTSHAGGIAEGDELHFVADGKPAFVSGTVDSIGLYMEYADDEHRERAIQKLREHEAEYRKALGRPARQRDFWVDGHYIAAPTAEEATEEAARLYGFLANTVRPWTAEDQAE